MTVRAGVQRRGGAEWPDDSRYWWLSPYHGRGVGEGVLRVRLRQLVSGRMSLSCVCCYEANGRLE
jgi:hypothetical protein